MSDFYHVQVAENGFFVTVKGGVYRHYDRAFMAALKVLQSDKTKKVRVNRESVDQGRVYAKQEIWVSK